MPPKKRKLPQKIDVVKSLTAFVKDEDGFVSRETILRVGLSTVMGMAVVGAAMDAAADHTNHSNSVGVHGCCFDHSNVTTHSSY